MAIKFLKTRSVKSPSRGNSFDAGIDFYVPEFSEEFLEALRSKNTCYISNDLMILKPGDRALIPSGIHCQMSGPGRALIAANKSGIASKYGLIFGAQVVDYEYQGELHISVINTGVEDINILPGMKILQFIETPIYNSSIIIEEDSSLEEFYKEKTERGAGGFGSTDNK